MSVLLSPISTTGPRFLVTRTMSTTKPYDPSTPPRAPLTNDCPPTLRVVPKSVDRETIADHGQAPLVIRGLDTPRQVPREENSAARDVLYHRCDQGTARIVRNTSSVRRRRSSVAVPKRVSPLHNGCANRIESQSSSQKEQRILKKLRDLTSRKSSSSSLTVVPKKLSLLGRMLEMAERGIDRKPSAGEEIQTWKNKFRNKYKDRPDFDVEFSFETPAKRKLECHTPPESPKGSFYAPDDLLPIPPPINLGNGCVAYKRKRISAGTFRDHRVFNPEHTYPNHTPAKAPGDYMQRRVSKSDDFIYNGKLQKPPFVEPHPGTPVVMSPSEDRRPSSSETPQGNVEHDADFIADYVDVHDMLPDDDDYKAFASGRHPTSKDKTHWKNKFSYDGDEDSNLVEMNSRTESKQSRASTASTRFSSRAASSVRMRSIGTMTTSSSISSNPARDSKLEAVLESVRSSRAAREKAEEQRKSWRKSPIWTDEHKMGSLGDGSI